MKKAISTGKKWFLKRGWKVKPFQQEVWEQVLANKNGLLNAPTGSGKTLALFTPMLLREYSQLKKNSLVALWVTPLRSLAKEIADSTQKFALENDIEIRVEIRNGDTPPTTRKKQLSDKPFMLVITPESLHLMLSYKESDKIFKDLKYIVVDEWHELLSTKRGVQTELAIANLKKISTSLVIWGVSATIGNLKQAAEILLHNDCEHCIIKDQTPKKIEIKTLLPKEFSVFSWAGHLGKRLLPQVLETVKKHHTSLIFTNTRSQCETWYRELLDAEPELAGLIALHHGSLSKELRLWVENALKQGKLKAVICTSSLDLGVDFPQVDAVIQIGGAKGVARFLQRAGRSGHRPGATSQIYFVPTHALEIIEGAAMKDAVEKQDIEDRIPRVLSYDVLVQFVVTLALTERYTAAEILEIAKDTFAFQQLNDAEWNWTLNFLIHGSQSLGQYDEYKKLIFDENQILKPVNRRVAQWHRMNIGTIVSDDMLPVKFVKGGTIGHIEEWFVSKMNKGDAFHFAGRLLELVRIHQMEVQVKISKKSEGRVSGWMGGRFPLSSRLGEHIRNQFSVTATEYKEEHHFLQELFDKQNSRSKVPENDEFLMEFTQTREGYHLFCFPFEGRFVNEALAGLVAFRLSLLHPMSFSLAFNDYGFELLSPTPFDPQEILDNNFFSSQDLTADLTASLNASEMAKRKFRDIAVIAGLVYQGLYGKSKKTRQLQASTQLLFDIFRDYEADNLLFRQSYTETFEEAMEEERLRKALDDIRAKKIVLLHCKYPSPFAFPILADRLRASLSSEKLEARLERMIKQFSS